MTALCGSLHRPAALAIALGAALVADRADACACCAEPGTRFEVVARLDDYATTMLEQLQLAGEADLYTTACGMECVTGIDSPGVVYAIALRHDDGRWRFEFRDAVTAAGGTLAFSLPAEYVDFAVDPAPEANVHSVVLYKEWRLTMPVGGTGIFGAVSAERASLSLVLHGSGNACDMIDDFTHWTLSVTGPGTDFRFFGKLAPHP